MEKFKILCNEMWDNEELFCIAVNDIAKIYPFKKQIIYKGNLTNTISTILNARLSDSKNSDELRKWDLPMMIDYVTVINFKIFNLRFTITRTKLANGWTNL